MLSLTLSGICGKLKDPSCYSQKEINTYTYKKATGGNVDFITARLRCRNCTSGGNSELKCAGPCGIYQSLEMFSKSARSNGGSKVSLPRY
jgi:hypothetical protein